MNKINEYNELIESTKQKKSNRYIFQKKSETFEKKNSKFYGKCRRSSINQKN